MRRVTKSSTDVSAAPARRLRLEILLVLALSLGQSAVYAVVSLIAKLTQGPLRDATATLNPSRTSRPYLDLTYQLLGIGFALVPVALALFLLYPGDRGTTGGLRSRLVPRRADWGWGVGLALVIGLPGLGFYYVGRYLGITAEVVPAALNEHWWSIPVLVLSAVQNAVVEEVIVVAYLLTRLRQLGWSTRGIVVASALLRGAYHLYQGFGPFLGNAVMGVVFAGFYLRYKRVLPLVIAHTLLDIVAFVGYWLLLR